MTHLLKTTVAAAAMLANMSAADVAFADPDSSVKSNASGWSAFLSSDNSRGKGSKYGGYGSVDFDGPSSSKPDNGPGGNRVRGHSKPSISAPEAFIRCATDALGEYQAEKTTLLGNGDIDHIDYSFATALNDTAVRVDIADHVADTYKNNDYDNFVATQGELTVYATAGMGMGVVFQKRQFDYDITNGHFDLEETTLGNHWGLVQGPEASQEDKNNVITASADAIRDMTRCVNQTTATHSLARGPRQ